MSIIRKYLSAIRRMPEENIASRDRLTELARINCQKKAPLILPGEVKRVIRFVCAEAERIKALLPNAASYRTADTLCSYADNLTGLMTALLYSTDQLTGEQNALMTSLWESVDDTRVLEHAIDEMFDRSEESEVITEYDLSLVMNVLSPITDQYRRNGFALGMLYYAKKLSRLTPEAEACLQDYTAGEMIRLRYIGDGMTDDDAEGLEYLADLCRYILNDRLTKILNVLPDLHRPNVSYYVLNTLLSGRKDLPEGLISELAHDEEYAALTKTALDKAGMSRLFPLKCADRTALCRSALIHWLVQPAELGKKPDEIRLLCSVGLEDGTLRVFRFRSDSSALPEEIRNQWLVGWSDGEGETFSEYEPLSRIKAKTPDKLAAYFNKELG